MLLAYLDHAERHYRTPDGKPTSEIYVVRVVTDMRNSTGSVQGRI